ncbi:hypothetical protein GYMLUDRAFT_595496 [Collybiopsis luxurians FD-317 M1]|uniref:Uncharacterized protein n=1 Tax=Collybiopsis luxurians FD-317 M1 TaxID=944289 RepID=A0A0D0CE38_9AGAR|nr:hypothetical protein GYMLUDRAFT_595496 [Collybiopsis luxurians FD-317 M1]
MTCKRISWKTGYSSSERTAAMEMVVVVYDNISRIAYTQRTAVCVLTTGAKAPALDGCVFGIGKHGRRVHGGCNIGV